MNLIGSIGKILFWMVVWVLVIVGAMTIFGQFPPLWGNPIVKPAGIIDASEVDILVLQPVGYRPATCRVPVWVGLFSETTDSAGSFQLKVRDEAGKTAVVPLRRKFHYPFAVGWVTLTEGQTYRFSFEGKSQGKPVHFRLDRPRLAFVSPGRLTLDVFPPP